MAEEFTITLTADEALVLSQWLDQVIGTREFDAIVNRDRVVWAPLHCLSGTLETAIPEIFAPDYTSRLEAVRERLLMALGDVGTPAADGGESASGPCWGVRG